MMKYNPAIRKNIYRRKSIRLKGWDYSKEGLYFITICTKNKECLFGSVQNGTMELNEIGWIADQYWKEIPKHYHHVKLHEFILMPNHLHGIIQIVSQYNADDDYNAPQTRKFGNPIPGSISTIINQYKSSVKRWCNQNGYENFKWQSRFHDHIIGSTEEFNRIERYIRNNPMNWHNDEMYTSGRP